MLAKAADGPLIAALGALFVTVTAALVAVARALPAAFLAVPALIDMASVPSPETADIVTVRDRAPVPETETVPFAVPVLIRVTFEAVRLIVSARSYVTV